MKALIIPDIHGRTFWKEPCEWAVKNNIQIIFLGDYFDPYNYEGITPEMAIENGKELGDFVNKNRELCITLIGNHDLEYLGYPWFPQGGRHSLKHQDEIINLLCRLPLQLAYLEDNHLFTHAGISSRWGKVLIDSPYWDEDKSPDDNLNILLNKALVDKERKAKDILSYVGYARGGYDSSGSCVWADVSETVQCKPFMYYIQVTGHNQLENYVYARKFNGKDHPNLNTIWYLDCRKAFIIDDNNEIKPWKNENEN
jgi:hypothetical protein